MCVCLFSTDSKSIKDKKIPINFKTGERFRDFFKVGIIHDTTRILK